MWAQRREKALLRESGCWGGEQGWARGFVALTLSSKEHKIWTLNSSDHSNSLNWHVSLTDHTDLSINNQARVTYLNVHIIWRHLSASPGWRRNQPWTAMAPAAWAIPPAKKDGENSKLPNPIWSYKFSRHVTCIVTSSTAKPSLVALTFSKSHTLSDLQCLQWQSRDPSIYFMEFL